jgi:hypothetical protein
MDASTAHRHVRRERPLENLDQIAFFGLRRALVDAATKPEKGGGTSRIDLANVVGERGQDVFATAVSLDEAGLEGADPHLKIGCSRLEHVILKGQEPEEAPGSKLDTTVAHAEDRSPAHAEIEFDLGMVMARSSDPGKIDDGPGLLEKGGGCHRLQPIRTRRSKIRITK